MRAGRPLSPKPVASCEVSETVAQSSFVSPIASFTPPRSNVRPFMKPENTFVFGVLTVQNAAPSTSPFRTISPVSLVNVFWPLAGMG